jgi:hypothetical protein
MRIDYPSKAWSIVLAGCLLCLLQPAIAFADAKTDLSISPKGTCAGGMTFVITNNNPSSSIHASVTRTNRDSETATTLDLSFQPGEQKVLGCAPQTAAGNFQITWQVQSAQYL